MINTIDSYYMDNKDSIEKKSFSYRFLCNDNTYNVKFIFEDKDIISLKFGIENNNQDKDKQFDYDINYSQTNLFNQYEILNSVSGIVIDFLNKNKIKELRYSAPKKLNNITKYIWNKILSDKFVYNEIFKDDNNIDVIISQK